MVTSIYTQFLLSKLSSFKFCNKNTGFGHFPRSSLFSLPLYDAFQMCWIATSIILNHQLLHLEYIKLGKAVLQVMQLGGSWIDIHFIDTHTDVWMLCVCIYCMYMHTYIHVYTHTPTHIYMYTSLHIWKSVSPEIFKMERKPDFLLQMWLRWYVFSACF